MKVEVQDLSSVEKKVTVEIPAERVKDEFELAFKDLQKTAHLKGFRPGKAPMKLLESHFKDYIREKVMRKLLEETLSPALERKQLKPITEPAIDLGELKEENNLLEQLNKKLNWNIIIPEKIPGPTAIYESSKDKKLAKELIKVYSSEDLELRKKFEKLKI